MGGLPARSPTFINFPREGTQLEATMKAFIAAVIGAAFLLGLTACNTVEGVGQDVKAAGSKVEREATEHKRY